MVEEEESKGETDDTGLVKMFTQVFHKMLQENLNELCSQPNRFYHGYLAGSLKKVAGNKFFKTAYQEFFSPSL